MRWEGVVVPWKHGVHLWLTESWYFIVNDLAL